SILFGLLFLFSPFLLLMSSTIMVHSPELFLASSLIYLFRRQLEESTLVRSVAILILLLVGMLVRGFALLPFLLPLLVFCGAQYFKKRQIDSLIAIVAGIAIGAALLGWFQWKTTGSPFVPGYRLVYKDYHYGFGKSLEGQVHTPLRGLENSSNELLGLNDWLTGWPS